MALHETLGKILRAFQHGTGFRGTDDGHVLQQVVMAEVVVDAFHQRVFRTDHHHVDFFVDDELCHSIEVVGFDVDVGACKCGSGITGSDEEFFDARTLRNFPCEGVLTAAAAQKQEFHKRLCVTVG